MIIISPFIAGSQQHYNLQQLVDASVAHLPSLKQKEALVNASKASLTDVKHSFLPQVRAFDQLSIGSDNSLPGSYFNFGVAPSTSGGVRSANNFSSASGNLVSLYGEYELANFGLNDAKLAYAQSAIGVQEADLQKEQYVVRLQVARLYFNLLKDQYRLDADKQNIDRYQHIFDVIHALTSSGIKAGSDSSLAKAELSKTRISYNQTAGRIGQLKEQIAFLTGVASSQLSIDTVANVSLRSQPLIQDFVMDTTGNPLINYYAKQQQLLKSGENVIRKTYLPKIILGAGAWARGSSIEYNDQYKSLVQGLGYQRFNYAVGVGVTYNLFNSMYKRDKLAINRFQSQASEFELEQQKLALNTASSQADQLLLTARANLNELPIQLQSAQDTYAQKLAQYKAGIISLVDLTNASFVLYRSQTDYIETLSDWYLAQLEKAAATGNLNSFIQTIR